MSALTRRLAASFVLCALGSPSGAAAQTILIYGPGGSSASSRFSGSPTVTVATEATWRGMTTEDFGGFDLLWVGGDGSSGCASSPAALQALYDTQAAWAPAVTGRVVLTTGDADFHASSSAGAVTFIQNHQAWLSALGATETGGQTGMYISSGCAGASSTGAVLDPLEATYGATIAVDRRVFTNPDLIFDPGHPLMAGLTTASLVWGNFSHGVFQTAIPTGFTPLLRCSARYCHMYRDEIDTCGTDQCRIGTACIDDGRVNPGNACEVCDVARAATAWSPRAAGTTCDDGLFCTVDDQCDGARSCGGAARDCGDGLTCTTDSCDEADDECDHPITDGCLIGGACRAVGDANPDNECEACFPTAPPGGGAGSRTSWLPVAMGTTCDDGFFCTLTDTCDGAASCGGTPRACADLLDCTLDRCNETADACEHPVLVGCAIDGMCVPDGMVDPASACRACRPLVSPTAWSPAAAGTTCDDGAFCTTGDACDAAGECVGTPRDCGDGLACTLDACDDAADECTHTTDATTSCTIDGECVANGATNPDNDCEVCDSSADATGWTPVGAGAACTDGAFCTTGDVCDGAGRCAGTARDCDDALACTTDTCDEAADACTNALVSGCAIGGACFATGAASPTDPCRVCDPTRATDAFSMAVAGTACDDGAACTTGDTCDAAGVCGGAPRDCDDGLDCTADRCNELSGECVSAVAEGCLVDGACVGAEAVDPGNPCAWCDPAIDDEGFSPRPSGERCGDPVCTDDGFFAPAPTCDDEGDCVMEELEMCEAGTCEDETTCAGGCTGDDFCPEDTHCDDGECVPDADGGGPCARDEMCASGFCVDGVCCDGRCGGRCEACGADGACAPLEAGADPDDECEGDLACDGAGACGEVGPTPDAGGVDAGPAGGTDAGSPADGGGAGVDAGEGVRTTGSGCGCRAPGAGPSSAGWALLWVALWVRARRRR